MTDMLNDLAKALAPERRLRIVDVGASPVGLPIYAPLMEAGCGEVTGFEPQPDAFEALTAYAPEHTTYVQKAVGGGGKGVLHSWKNAPGMASLFPIRRPSVRYLGRFRGLVGQAQETELSTEALDDMDEVPQIDLLKIDVQGSERDIIRAGQAKLGSAVAVITEMRYYQLYRGEPPMWSLDHELRKQGFVLHRFLNVSRTMLPSPHADALSKAARSQAVDGDVIYIRPLEEMDGWDDESLIRLALCAAGVFESHDLTLMILAELEKRGRIDGEVARAYLDALPARYLAEEVSA